MQFNTLTLTLQNFITALSGAYGRIQGSASTLLGILVGIEVVLLGLWTALGGGDNVVGVFKRILHIGAWVWIVQSYPTLSKAFVESLVKAGLLAGGGTGDVSLLMDPSRLAGYGLDATEPLTHKLADLGMTDLSDLIVFGFGYLAILACFLIMAINVFLAVLEYYVFAALAGIFLPFGLLRADEVPGREGHWRRRLGQREAHGPGSRDLDHRSGAVEHPLRGAGDHLQRTLVGLSHRLRAHVPVLEGAELGRRACSAARRTSGADHLLQAASAPIAAGVAAGTIAGRVAQGVSATRAAATVAAGQSAAARWLRGSAASTGGGGAGGASPGGRPGSEGAPPGADPSLVLSSMGKAAAAAAAPPSPPPAA